MTDDNENRPDFRPGRKALEALASFASRLRDPDAEAGEWDRPRSTTLGVFDSPELRAAGIAPGTRVTIMPHFNPSDLLDDFVQMAYDEGWVVSFDWSAWAVTPEGRSIVNSPEAIFRASQEQLARTITAHVRKERFCEGSLEDAFKDGILLAAAERASALLSVSR